MPIKQNYYRRSQKEREYVDSELEKMLASGVIRPSKSPWGAPNVLVRKKTGELHFCIDFRRLNEVTKKDAYPLPRIDECLDALEGSKFFSTLDLAKGVLAGGYGSVRCRKDSLRDSRSVSMDCHALRAMQCATNFLSSHGDGARGHRLEPMSRISG